jgi:hypothetical protein
MIGRDRRPEQVAGVTPAVEDDSFSKWLTFRRNNDAIVFAQISRSSFRPMQLECRCFHPVEVRE